MRRILLALLKHFPAPDVVVAAPVKLDGAEIFRAVRQFAIEEKRRHGTSGLPD